MRALLTVPSSTARLHNLVPLGWALRTAGHQVQVAGRPEFTDEITATGMIAVPADGDGLSDVDSLVARADRWRPDVVVWDSLAPAGALTARAVGVPGVRMLGPLDPRSDTGAGADATLDFLPPSLRLPAEREHLSVRHVSYAGSAVLPAWLRRKPRKRRVYVAVDHTTLAALFDAVAGSAAEFVCELSPDRTAPGTRLPANVRLVEPVPRDVVLASCAAVVHDGAPEVIMAALAGGLPQLVLANATPDLATRVAEEGAAVLVDPATADGAAFDRLLDDPDVAKNAARLREEVLAMPSPRDVVPQLVAMAEAK